MSDVTIKQDLYGRLRRSSVTIVLLTPSAVNHKKNWRGGDYDDWMYDEIRYSLESREGNRTNGLLMYISAAVSYAESYQHIEAGYYSTHDMPPTTEQAVIMLSSHFYESRDGSTGGFFADRPEAARQVWNTVNLLLRLDRDWKV